MKRYLLHRLALIVVFAMGTMGVLAQATVAVKVNGSDVVANINATPFNDPALKKGVITDIIDPSRNPTGPSDANPIGKCNMWLEFGDGGYTTNPSSSRNLRSTGGTPYLFLVPLYDTSRGKDGIITRMMTTSPITGSLPTASKSANDSSLLAATNSNIKITPNNYSIVKGEPKVLALTYRIKPPSDRQQTDVLTRQGAKGLKYYVVLYYNKTNKNVFNPLVSGSTSAMRYTSTGTTATMPDIRLFNNDAVVPEDQVGPSAPSQGYDNKLVIALGAFSESASSQDEGNIFVTLKTRTGRNFISVGDSSSIMVKYIATVDGQNTVVPLGTAELSNMYIADAFDPNHLVQSPSCFVLPKGGKQLQYALHFENIGEGPADMVRILFHRPQGLENAALNVQSIQFAGRMVNIAGGGPFTYRHSQTADKKVDTFFIATNTPDLLQMLLGTGQPGGGGIGSKGCIRFTLAVTAETPDSLTSFAENEFHSHFGNWEAPVPTNKGKTVYREKECQCNETCIDGSCYIILGLCWWWWALILLVLLLLIWLLRRRR